MNRKNDLKRVIDEVDYQEPVGCPQCWQGPVKQSVKTSFTYRGSSLGPFEVKDAKVFECGSCGSVWYSRSESKLWEARKAVDTVLRAKRLNGKEVRFLRQMMGRSLSELAADIGVDKSTITRWEIGGATLQGSKQLTALLLVHMLSGYILTLQQKGPQGEAVITLLRKWLERLQEHVQRPVFSADFLEELSV